MNPAPPVTKSRMISQRSEYRPAESRASTNRATWFPIGSDAVAAGEGAFSTCTACGPSLMTKSSSRAPSRPTACARTPGAAGTRSAAVQLRDEPLQRADERAAAESERVYSPIPVRQ